jgi:hypothetical protein
VIRKFPLSSFLWQGFHLPSTSGVIQRPLVAQPFRGVGSGLLFLLADEFMGDKLLGFFVVAT